LKKPEKTGESPFSLFYSLNNRYLTGEPVGSSPPTENFELFYIIFPLFIGNYWTIFEKGYEN
jgi:hypothetical protein